MNLLIVEDDPDFAKELTGALRALEHSFVVAGDVPQALDVLAEQASSFDLVLSDVRLPGRDGLELLKMSRARYKELPVAIMTGHGDAEVTLKALRGGAFDFLSKPFGLTELEGMLARVPQMALHDIMQAEHILSMHAETGGSIISTQDSINSAVTLFREIFSDYCHALGRDVNAISLCLNEALQNAVIHGNFGIGSAQKDDFEGFDAFWREIHEAEQDDALKNKPVNLMIKTDGMDFSITVTDTGNGFDYANYDFAVTDTIATHGRGLRIMHELAKSVEFHGVGNSVTMFF